MELQKALLVAVLSLSGWSLLALLLDKRGQRYINRYLALLLAVLCIPQIYFYSRLLFPPDGVFALALITQAVIWLKGPFLWMMVRVATGHPPRRLYVHFVPFLLVVIVLLLQPDWLLIAGQSGLLQAVVYLLVSLRNVLTARARLALVYREYPNTSYYWLLWVIAGLLVMMLADFVLMGLIFIYQVVLIDAITWVSWLISGYLLSIAFFSVYRPRIFFHEAWQAESGTAMSEPVGQQPIAEKTWRELDEHLARQLAVQLEQLMREELLFRQGELSLAQLAARLGVSVHQTSELLNVHLGVSFYDYLNRYRLDYACTLLRNPHCEWRILDIVFESGFSNKNSFYRCFRAAYGVTPVDYRNRQLAQKLATADA